MNTSEFQIESASQLGNIQAADPSPEIIKLESFQASLESMILGYRLRGWLTDSEKQVLDCLAPKHHICFLMKGEKYLHPADCELFAHDIIRSSQSMPGDAIFQHRWEPDRSSQRGAYSIHSARINHFGDEPVTLGWLGPETDELSGNLIERFSRLTDMARAAWKESTPALKEITRRFETNYPYLLVNRCSGRILHVSQSAPVVFDCPAEQIVDQEFSSARTALAQVMRNYRLKMTRFTTGPYMFASVELIASPRMDSNEKSGLTADLTDKLKNKLISIQSASDYLVAGTGEIESEKTREIGQMIQNETQLAAQVLSRMQLLLSWGNAGPIETSLTEAIEQATVDLDRETGNEFDLRVDPKPIDLTVTAPPDGLKTLIQTVILSHLELGATHARLKCTNGLDGPIMVFSSDIDHSSVDPATLWSAYSAKLAGLMNIRLTSSHEPTSGAITTLEISASRRTVI